jgi:hypothetical protein
MTTQTIVERCGARFLIPMFEHDFDCGLYDKQLHQMILGCPSAVAKLMPRRAELLDELDSEDAPPSPMTWTPDRVARQVVAYLEDLGVTEADDGSECEDLELALGLSRICGVTWGTKLVRALEGQLDQLEAQP